MRPPRFWVGRRNTNPPAPLPHNGLQQGAAEAEANFPAGRPNSREITSQVITVLSVPILASMDQGIRPLEGHTDSRRDKIAYSLAP